MGFLGNPQPGRFVQVHQYGISATAEIASGQESDFLTFDDLIGADLVVPLGIS